MHLICSNGLLICAVCKHFYCGTKTFKQDNQKPNQYFSNPSSTLNHISRNENFCLLTLSSREQSAFIWCSTNWLAFLVISNAIGNCWNLNLKVSIFVPYLLLVASFYSHTLSRVVLIILTFVVTEISWFCMFLPLAFIAFLPKINFLSISSLLDFKIDYLGQIGENWKLIRINVYYLSVFTKLKMVYATRQP